MVKFKSFIIPMVSVLGSVLSTVFGGWNHLLILLLVAVVLDYILGVFIAFITGALSSRIGWRGIAKKVSIFALVSVAHIADVILGDSQMIRNATILFYLCNECISIIENASKAGVPIPKFLLNALEIISQKQEEAMVEKNHEKKEKDNLE
ncbi:hypothetical protein GCM10008967_15420 [Bacillus carboniphilus]|uniref:Holin n=1 Tax=Bacillus carboniphilus TaxID=86663 RepID=A0ABP3FTU1_9BACI